MNQYKFVSVHGFFLTLRKVLGPKSLYEHIDVQGQTGKCGVRIIGFPNQKVLIFPNKFLWRQVLYELKPSNILSNKINASGA